MGRAVGLVMQSSLRHLMTEYETLLLHGIARKKAATSPAKNQGDVGGVEKEKRG